MNLSIPSLIINEINNLITSKEFKNYITYGFEVEYDLYSCKLTVFYKKHQYTITLIEKENGFYWHLIPYNDSFFETSISNGLKMVLFAIKENEELYNYLNFSNKN